MCLTNRHSAYLENIILVLSGINSYIQDAIVYSFLPKGFEIYEIDNIDKLNYLLGTKDVSFLYIDVEQFGRDISKQLERIKESSKNKGLRIIASTNERSIPDLQQFFDEYLAFWIPSSFNETKVIESIKHFFDKVGIKHTERRKHIRVDVENNENLKITFPSHTGGALADAKALNISLGGALFQVHDLKKVERLHVGSRIEGLQIVIEGKIIRTSAVVAYRQEFLMAVRFTDIKENFIRILGKYIFKKLSTSINDIKG